MKKIIVFRKYGRLRFVGHLDMMRAFQRAPAASGNSAGLFSGL